MKKNTEAMNVWKALLRDKVPKEEKMISTKWAMKKKANGIFS